jgi:hypothetical protein
MENNSTKNNVEPEIDLWKILHSVGQWCAKTFVSLASTFVIFFVRKSVWLACFIFAGVLVGAIRYVFSKPYYSSSMYVQPHVGDNFFYVNLINEKVAPWNIESSTELVQKLSIPANIAKQIHSIRACYGIDLNEDGLPDAMDEDYKYISSRDSAEVAKVIRSAFYICAWVYANETLPYIRKSIMEFISKNDYVQRHNTHRLARIDEQITYLNYQLGRFDSLQQHIYFEKESPKKTASSGQLLVWNEQPQPLYHNDLISLNDQIIEKTHTMLLYPEPITIVHDFAEISKRKNTLLFYTKPLVINFLLIGFLILLILDYRKFFVDLYRGKITSLNDFFTKNKLTHPELAKPERTGQGELQQKNAE